MNNAYKLCCAVLVCASVQVHAAEAEAPVSPSDKLSYSIGASIGKNLKKESPDVDLKLLIEAFQESFAGKPLRMTESDMRVILGNYQVQLRQKALAERQQAMVDNKKAGDAFLEKNKARPGVQLLPSGVQYRVLKEGTGRKPLESDSVQVNYRGALVNGNQFDATEPGKPATLRVAALIAGWKQALTQMPVGSSWELVIPSALAYGERGSGDIGPNEVLVFQVDLIAIK